ncbi:lyso-ornithine lipid acyltransferase [Permianibacter aggregans]|uniref:Lyso-ornithine lipid acyltransferase n=2 Tax=Permianibacter aggregans TaxID=1510150 RepID=A0A4R6UMZ5_9GAMM|nr:lyso-ornithine lipid acyltransferase [Permianibacter aggregans]
MHAISEPRCNSADEAIEASTSVDALPSFDPIAFASLQGVARPYRSTSSTNASDDTRWRQLCRAVLVFLLILAGVLLVSIGLLLTWGRHPERIVQPFKQRWMRLLCKVMNVRITQHGEPAAGPILVVANHVSWLDIPVLSAQVPMSFVAKQDVLHWPVVGMLAKCAGTLFIGRGRSANRQNVSAVNEEMSERLDNGRRMVIFPEGTTTDGRQVQRFHPRLFNVACANHYPVQPVAIRYRGIAADAAPFIGEDEFLPHLWQLLKHPVLEVEVCWLPAVPAGEEPEPLAELTQRKILDSIHGC